MSNPAQEVKYFSMHFDRQFKARRNQEKEEKGTNQKNQTKMLKSQLSKLMKFIKSYMKQ